MTNPKPTITLDVDLYQQMLDDTNLTDAEKREFLETLWHIIVEFVQLGWGVHPLQRQRENSGELTETPCDSLITDSDMLPFVNQKKEV